MSIIVLDTLDVFVKQIELYLNVKVLKTFKTFSSLYSNYYVDMCNDMHLKLIDLSKVSRLSCSHLLIDMGVILPIFNKVKYMKYSEILEVFKKHKNTLIGPSFKVIMNIMSNECKSGIDHMFLSILYKWASRVINYN